MAKSFWAMDAGERREFLGLDLAQWKRAGFWSHENVRRFQNRVRFAATRLSMKVEDYMADLHVDAESVLAQPDADAWLDDEP